MHQCMIFELLKIALEYQMILWPQSGGRAICTRACTRLRSKRNNVIAKPGETLTGVSG